MKQRKHFIYARRVLLSGVLVSCGIFWAILLMHIFKEEEAPLPEPYDIELSSKEEIAQTLDQAESLYNGFTTLYKEGEPYKENVLALSMLHRSRMMVYSLISPYQFSSDFLVEGNYFPLPAEGTDYSRLFEKWRSSVYSLVSYTKKG